MKKRFKTVGKSYDEDFPLPNQEVKIRYGYTVYIDEDDVIQFLTIGKADLPGLLGLHKVVADKLQDISNKNRGKAKRTRVRKKGKNSI